MGLMLGRVLEEGHEKFEEKEDALILKNIMKRLWVEIICVMGKRVIVSSVTSVGTFRRRSAR